MSDTAQTTQTQGTAQTPIPTPTLPTIQSVLDKTNEVMDLNKLLRDALENATQSLLNVSVATEEQIALVVEFTKEQEQDITLQGGVVIPNALKLVNALKQKAQELADLIKADYDAEKKKTAEELKQEFKDFIALKNAEVQEFKNDSANALNERLQALEAQMQTQAQEFDATKQEVQEKLDLINTDAFLNEFAELRVNMEVNIQKINTIMSNHALLIAKQSANNAVAMQKLFTLIKRKEHNGNTESSTGSAEPSTDNTEPSTGSTESSTESSTGSTEPTGGNDNDSRD